MAKLILRNMKEIVVAETTHEVHLQQAHQQLFHLQELTPQKKRLVLKHTDVLVMEDTDILTGK